MVCDRALLGDAAVLGVAPSTSWPLSPQPTVEGMDLTASQGTTHWLYLPMVNHREQVARRCVGGTPSPFLGRGSTSGASRSPGTAVMTTMLACRLRLRPMGS